MECLKDLYAPLIEIDGSFIPKKILPEQEGQCYFDTGAVYVFDAQLIRDERPILDPSYTQSYKLIKWLF